MPRDEIPEQKTDAYIDGVWYTIARNTMTYNPQGKRITSENLAGQITTTAWDCCHKVSENRTDGYGYNLRGELVSATKNTEVTEYAYQYDDIGNRITSLDLGTNRTYTANSLNQYTAITDVATASSPSQDETFTPQFDDNGNQALIKTATGIWSVTYSGENRQILWSCIQSNNSNNPNNQTILSMSYDRIGRRVTKNDQRFVYDGCLQIANFEHQTSNIKLQTFIWDPTEKIATRPLWMQIAESASNYFYFHDGNKNVSDLVSLKSGQCVVAHYEYAPFGSALAAVGGVAVASCGFELYNPYRYSSEYADDSVGLVYYNYRHYEPVMGRWISRDPQPRPMSSLYAMAANNPVGAFDWLGLDPDPKKLCEDGKKSAESSDQVKDITRRMNNRQCSFTAKCECCNIPGRFGELTTETARSSTLTLCIDGPNKTAKDFKETYIHELIHANDHCGYNEREFTCDHKICSELKAYSEDGSCKSGGSYRLPEETERECIERGALNSVFDEGRCKGKAKGKLKEEIAKQFLYCVSPEVRKRIREESKK